MYVEALLHELKLGDFDDWISTVAAGGVEGSADLSAVGQDAIRVVLNQLLAKVSANEKWTNLPSGSERDIAQNVPKIISLALRDAINAARQGTSSTSSSYCPVTPLLAPSSPSYHRHNHHASTPTTPPLVPQPQLVDAYLSHTFRPLMPLSGANFA